MKHCNGSTVIVQVRVTFAGVFLFFLFVHLAIVLCVLSFYSRLCYRFMAQILLDTRNLKKEINSNLDALNRSYSYTTEVVYAVSGDIDVRRTKHCMEIVGFGLRIVV